MPSVYDDQEIKTPSADELTESTRITEIEQGEMEKRTTDENGAANDILAKENNVASDEVKNDSLYNPSASKKRGRSISLSSGQKRGGLAGLVICLAFAGISTLSLGPLQIIHFAQMMQSFHFADQEADTNKRTSRITKFFFYDKNVEKTRLTLIQNRVATKFEAKLAKSGYSMSYDKAGRLNYIAIDTKKAGFKNAQDSRARAEIAAAHDVDIKYVQVGSDGKMHILPDGTKRIKNGKLVAKMIAISGDHGKITSYYNKRLQIKKAGWTFNPLTKMDRAINDTALKGIKKIQESRKARLASKTQPVTAAGAPAGENATEAEKAAAQENAKGASETNKAKTAGKGALGGAAVIGLACIVKHIVEDVDSTKKMEGSRARMQASVEVLSVAAKAQDGKDIDMESLGEISKSLNNREKGKESNWSQASTLQHEQGKTGGVTLPTELSPNPEKGPIGEFFARSEVRAVTGAVCPIMENFIVQIALSATNIASSAAMFLAAPLIIDKITDIASGEAPDLSDPKYAGGPYGEIANVGAREAANQSASSTGGRVLSENEEVALNEEVKEIKNSEDSTRSIADKYLNPHKYDTAVAKMIDSPTVNNPRQTVAKLPSLIFGSIGSSLKLLSSNASAADNVSTKEAYYGIPKVGFEPGVLDSDQFDNPYKNAEEASLLLKGPNKETYKKRLEKCNLIKVIETQEGGSTVIDYEQIQGIIPDYDSLPAECKNDNDPNFVKIRVAILDTITMQSFACTQLDDEESCSAISGQGTASTEQATSQTDPSSIDYSDDTSNIPCAAGKDLGPADGYKDGKKILIKLCDISGIDVNSQISGNIKNLIDASKTAGVDLANSGGFRTMEEQISLRKQNGCPDTFDSPSSSCATETARPGYSNHQMGLAIDFSCSGGGSFSFAGTKCFSWVKANAAKYGLKNLPSEPWHWSVDGT